MSCDCRTNETLIVRFVTPEDADALQDYFRSLSQQSRYNRLMGAASELPRPSSIRSSNVGENSRFAVIAEMKVDGVETIVGEARYTYFADSRSAEFGLSIGDPWRGRGIGSVMLGKSRVPVGRARCRSYRCRDLSHNNEQMIGLARKSGYDFLPAPYDWRQVRLEKGSSIGACGDPMRELEARGDDQSAVAGSTDGCLIKAGPISIDVLGLSVGSSCAKIGRID